MATTTDPRGVPLATCRAQGVGVRITCRDCQLHHDLPLEAVVERLQRRGVAAERVGIVELAEHVRTRCGRCGGRRFTTAPAFPAAR